MHNVFFFNVYLFYIHYSDNCLPDELFQPELIWKLLKMIITFPQNAI